MSIDVSLIIPLHNVEKYIEKLFYDLQNQKMMEAEFILVDDGSTDLTNVIIKEKLDHIRDDRFILIHQSNHGVSRARNTGIQKARGNYIMFADADDRFNDDFVSKYYEVIKQCNADLVLFSIDKISENGVTLQKGKYEKIMSENPLSFEQFIDLFAKFKIFGYPPSYISKASLWKNVKFDENITYQEDSLALFEVLLAKSEIRIYLNGTCHYYYVQHSTSKVHNLDVQSYEQAVRVNKKIVELVKQTNLSIHVYKTALLMEALANLSLLKKILIDNENLLYDEVKANFLNVYKKSSPDIFSLLKRLPLVILIRLNMKKILRKIFMYQLKKKY